MRRRVRRAPVAVRKGDTVVDARVRARLLGLPLLELDAQVVVAPQRDEPAAPAPVPAGVREARVLRGDGGTPPDLSRAVRLLAEGSRALEAAKRIG